MTVLSRGDRARRSGRRPGWLLLTVLLVFAIAASSALVFTNRVELLKLAVILSLWAAAVGAFVSAIYRRQSDTDQAKVRDLKMVYDLQLDREISARREYELNVETHLRRELANELRGQSSDEVAALRGELAALRTSLEILFDTDLAHRPALERDRSYAEWPGEVTAARPDRVASSRVTPARDDDESQTAESPIIDVPEEPLAPAPPTPLPMGSEAAEVRYRGSHRRPSDAEQTGRIPPVQQSDGIWSAAPATPWPPAPRTATPTPPMFTPQNGYLGAPDEETDRRGRHWPPSASGEVQPAADEPPHHAEPALSARHRGTDDNAPATGGQSVAELLARLQRSGSTEGGRRRRRAD